MTKDEYKSARVKLGFSVAEWIRKLGISMDTHKGYNSGRSVVQLPVANHIITLLELSRIKKSIFKTLK